MTLLLEKKSHWEKKDDILGKTLICEEHKFNKYKLTTKKCLDIPKKLYHGNQQYIRNCRPIKHKCRQKGEQPTCISLIKVNTK